MESQLSDDDVVQPDLVVVKGDGRRIVSPAKIKGIPALVVEILSKSTAELDRNLKKDLHERSGVPEYWIVDPDNHVLVQYVLADGRYELLGRHSDQVRSPGFEEAQVDLTRVW